MYFECDCGDKDHMLIFETFQWDENEKIDLTINAQLRNGNFLYRLKIALAYLFNKQTKYSQWDETLIHSSRIHVLKEFIDSVVEENEKYPCNEWK